MLPSRNRHGWPLVAKDSSPRLPVTPGQLMRPGIGENMSYTVGDSTEHLGLPFFRKMIPNRYVFWAVYASWLSFDHHMTITWLSCDSLPQVGDNVMFPGSVDHEQTFCYLIIDNFKRHVTAWYHVWYWITTLTSTPTETGIVMFEGNRRTMQLAAESLNIG